MPWRAGSGIGLLLATGAAALILVQPILARGRRPLPLTRVRLHVGLGAMALVLALLHTGLHFRGLAARVLVAVLLLVTGSGALRLGLSRAGAEPPPWAALHGALSWALLVLMAAHAIVTLAY
jgi:hypothetical protein